MNKCYTKKSPVAIISTPYLSGFIHDLRATHKEHAKLILPHTCNFTGSSTKNVQKKIIP